MIEAYKEGLRYAINEATSTPECFNIQQFKLPQEKQIGLISAAKQIKTVIVNKIQPKVDAFIEQLESKRLADKNKLRTSMGEKAYTQLPKLEKGIQDIKEANALLSVMYEVPFDDAIEYEKIFARKNVLDVSAEAKARLIAMAYFTNFSEKAVSLIGSLSVDEQEIKALFLSPDKCCKKVKPEYITAIGTKAARERVYDAIRNERLEKQIKRVYIVDQEYSYSENFLKTFHRMQARLNLMKPHIDTFYARQLKLRAAEKAQKEGQNIDEKTIEKARKEVEKSLSSLGGMYDTIRKIVEDEIKVYDELTGMKESNRIFGTEVSSDEDGFYVDKKTGLTRLPAPIQPFYPPFLEFLFRSYMLPEFAYERGRTIQATALNYEEGDDKRYMNTKDNFRETRDRLKLSRTKEDKMLGVIRLRNHMYSLTSVTNRKWVEAFELLSRSTKKKNWDNIIIEANDNYEKYLEWASTHKNYRMKMAALFDFPTPYVNTSGHSAGDAHPLDIGGKNMERGKRKVRY